MSTSHTDTSQSVGQTYSIHVDAEGTELPPHPGPGWTRFVCISDTHSRKYRVPSGDVLLHAGDLTSWGRLEDLSRTIEWLKSLDHPIKIIVAGNHDYCLDRNLGEEGWGLDPTNIERAQAYVHNQLRFGLHYLENESLHFKSPSGKAWKVYGSPETPIYVPGAFQYTSVTEAQETHNRIPNDTEILITHTPPYGMLDFAKRGQNAGCETLLFRMNELKYCRLHVFGHIHEAAGARVDNIRQTNSPRVSVNAAMEKSHSAIVVDLRD